MTQVPRQEISGAAACIKRAASYLAACSRPAPALDGAAADQQSSALTDLVAAAELFGCNPLFWRWAADAAELLGRATDAETYRKRLAASGEP